MGHPVNDVSNISPPPSLIHIWDWSTSTVYLSTPLRGRSILRTVRNFGSPRLNCLGPVHFGCRFRDEISSISQGMPEENLEKLSRSRDLEIMGEERAYPKVSTSSMIKFCTVHSLLSLIIKEIKSKITSRLSRARPNCKLLRFWQPQIAVRFHKPYRPAVPICLFGNRIPSPDIPLLLPNFTRQGTIHKGRPQNFRVFGPPPPLCPHFG